ncbi:MAG: hypothetical protein LBK27_01040 [Treponema sp.]|jgi:hypothetical protein|nr:hypothetical protein [Treponema sp.]
MTTVFFKVSIPLFLAGLALSLTACPPALDSGAGKLRLVLSGGGARAALSPDTINSLSYKLVFSGPGGETLSREAGPGTGALSLTLTPGRWNIRAEAFEEGQFFGLGETAVTVEAGKTAEAVLAMKKFSTVWYVAAGGNDITGTGSEAAPFATVNGALEAIAALYGASSFAWPNKGTAAAAPARILVSGDITTGLTGDNMVEISDSALYTTYPPIILAGATADDSENSIDASSDARVVYIVNADLTLGPGLTLTGGDADLGGGVYVEANFADSTASFTMTGGTISGNTATAITGNPSSGVGGGVWVGTRAADSTASFTMTGGTISSNTALSGGGGYVEANSSGSTASFTMIGETISGNTASVGGGVWVGTRAADSTAFFTMIGGTISGNTASSADGGSAGGGVYVVENSGSTTATAFFTMRGGTIRDNTASSSFSPTTHGKGGGVYVDSGGTFTKSSGTIYGDDDTTHTSGSDENTATTGDGHAVYVYSSPSKKRNTDAGPELTLDSTTSENWGE